MKNVDEGTQTVRDVREKISLEFGNDPEKLVAHYMKQQEQYRHRLLQPVDGQHDEADLFPESEAV